MKNRSAIGNGFHRLVLLCSFLVFVAAGCSKHEDDCSAPKEDETETTARSFSGDQSNDIDTQGRPSSTSCRGPESNTEDPDGDGISDDGDDEADGEGNKKNRPGH